MFYNTINIKGSELNSAHKKSSAQEIKIMEYYGQNPYAIKTSLELADELKILFTSVRRAVTNLIAQDKLKYCGMKQERFGKPNHLIALKIEYGQQKLF